MHTFCNLLFFGLNLICVSMSLNLPGLTHLPLLPNSGSLLLVAKQGILTSTPLPMLFTGLKQPLSIHCWSYDSSQPCVLHEAFQATLEGPPDCSSIPDASPSLGLWLCIAC